MSSIIIGNLCSENNMKELGDCEFSSKYDAALLFFLFPYKLT
jgi:hypothetical protein